MDNQQIMDYVRRKRKQRELRAKMSDLQKRQAEATMPDTVKYEDGGLQPGDIALTDEQLAQAGAAISEEEQKRIDQINDYERAKAAVANSQIEVREPEMDGFDEFSYAKRSFEEAQTDTNPEAEGKEFPYLQREIAEKQMDAGAYADGGFQDLLNQYNTLRDTKRENELKQQISEEDTIGGIGKFASRLGAAFVPGQQATAAQDFVDFSKGSQQELKDVRSEQADKLSGMLRMAQLKNAMKPDPAAKRDTKVIDGKLVDTQTGKIVYEGKEQPKEFIKLNNRLIDPVTKEVVLDLSDKKDKDPKTIQMGGSLVERQADGSYKEVFKTEKEVKPIAVGKGASLVDPRTGKLLYKNDSEKGKKLADTLTPGQKKVDEAYAKKYVDWVQNDKAAVESDFKKINSLIKDMKNKKEMWEGTLDTGVEYMPFGKDAARALINPDLQDIQDRVFSIIQRDLKKTLGGQFAKEEADRFLATGFNPRLGAEANIKRVKDILDLAKKQYNIQNRQADHFKNEGTISNYREELSAKDKAALNWAKQNPDDPRASKIREKLGQ